MQMQDTTRKEIITYLGITLALSAIFYTLILSARSLSAAGGLYTMGLMWCPGVSAILTSLIYRRSLRELGWGFGKARYLLTAYAAPILYALPVYALVWVTVSGAFNTSAEMSWVQILILATAGVLMSCLSALGEEIGWRGFLVPRLARLTTFRRTSLISGVIWALWHSPLILFSDYKAQTPAWYSLLCFAVLVISISFLFAWLRIQSGSLWPAVLLHASHNLFIQAIFDPLTSTSGLAPYITGEFGAGLALTGLMVAILLWRRGETPAPISTQA